MLQSVIDGFIFPAPRVKYTRDAVKDHLIMVDRNCFEDSDDQLAMPLKPISEVAELLSQGIQMHAAARKDNEDFDDEELQDMSLDISKDDESEFELPKHFLDTDEQVSK